MNAPAAPLAALPALLPGIAAAAAAARHECEGSLPNESLSGRDPAPIRFSLPVRPVLAATEQAAWARADRIIIVRVRESPARPRRARPRARCPAGRVRRVP